MNIIFLDIDGVLNSPGYYLSRNQQPFPFSIDRSDDIDPVPCKLLNDFCLEHDIKIVLSSTWRRDHNEKQIMKVFRKRGLNVEVVGLTPVLYKQRGDEINEFLRTTTLKIDKYAILDDDGDFYSDQPLVQTHWDSGLTEKHIKKLEQIFAPFG